MRLRDLEMRAANDPGFARRIVLLVCALYAVSFLAFFPRTLTNDDESHYRDQALLIIEGRTSVTRIDAFTGEETAYAPLPYPLGNALAMAPFVALLGWRGGFLVAFVSLLLGVWWLLRWLESEGRSPLFALLVLGYPPALVMGRVCMSDMPSLAIVTGGLLLFWRGIERGPAWWLASGFVAGGSMIFRESNPILFAPFFLGALLRRERNVWALVVGGLAGLSLRLVSNAWFHGETLFYKSGYILALDTIGDRLPIYLFAMLVMVPGGLVLSLLYRGRRRPELVIAVALFFTLYLIQRYYTYATSPVKRMIITPRYLLPLVPVVAFAMAESVPRLWRRLLERTSEARRRRLSTWAPRLVTLWVAGIAGATLAVHPAFHLWSETQARMRNAFAAHAPPDAILVTNSTGTRKFIDELSRKHLTVDARRVGGPDVRRLLERHGELYLALLDRSDSEFWRAEMQTHRGILDALVDSELLYDEQVTGTDRLRIWRARAPRKVAP